VKEATIIEREFKNFRLTAEAVAEFAYQPTACTKPYRMVVVRKNISVEQGDQRLFDQIRYFFYLLSKYFDKRYYADARIIETVSGAARDRSRADERATAPLIRHMYT
jgi:hypothetical protein